MKTLFVLVAFAALTGCQHTERKTASEPSFQTNYVRVPSEVDKRTGRVFPEEERAIVLRKTK